MAGKAKSGPRTGKGAFKGSKATLRKINKARRENAGTAANKRQSTKAGTPAKSAGGRAFQNDF